MMVTIIGLFATSAWAAGAGGGMPWETPLTAVTDSITGPVAQRLAVLAIAVFGLTLAWGGGEGLGAAIRILFGISIAFAAASFGLSFFGFAGGCLIT